MPQQVDVSITWSVIGALSVVNPVPPNATLGQAYSHQFSAIGGTPPYTWSIAAGSLPPGLSLSSDGLVSGTSTTAGDYNVTIRVQDSG